jgi:hypothetical protein
MEYPTPYVTTAARESVWGWWAGALTGFSLGFALGLAIATAAAWWAGGSVLQIRTLPASLTNRVEIAFPDLPIRREPPR